MKRIYTTKGRRYTRATALRERREWQALRAEADALGFGPLLMLGMGGQVVGGTATTITIAEPYQEPARLRLK